MINNFEEKYASLLEDIDYEELMPFPNPELFMSLFKIEDIPHVKNAFIARYCFGNISAIDDSNKQKIKK